MDILNCLPTKLENLEEIDNGIDEMCSTFSEETNNFFSIVMSPSRIMTKRKHSFLSPQSKKIRRGHERNSRKEKPQFEKVGRVCSNSRKSMEKNESTFFKKTWKY